MYNGVTLPTGSIHSVLCLASQSFTPPTPPLYFITKSRKLLIHSLGSRLHPQMRWNVGTKVWEWRLAKVLIHSLGSRLHPQMRWSVGTKVWEWRLAKVLIHSLGPRLHPQMRWSLGTKVWEWRLAKVLMNGECHKFIVLILESLRRYLRLHPLCCSLFIIGMQLYHGEQQCTTYIKPK